MQHVSTALVAGGLAILATTPLHEDKKLALWIAAVALAAVIAGAVMRAREKEPQL